MIFLVGLFLSICFSIEFFVNFLSLPFYYICGHLKSVILNCCKKKTVLFFLQMGFIIISFASYTFFYSMMFREMEKGELPNPPQVIAQLCSLFFLFKYPPGPGHVRERHMLLLSLFLSFLSSFFFRGGSPQLLFGFSLCYVLVIRLFPLNSSDFSLFILLSFYSSDKVLSNWGFFLVVQLFFFLVIKVLFFFAKEQPCPKNRFVHFLCVGAFMLLSGYLRYNDNYLLQPAKLSILFSGACIIYISLKKRTKLEFWVCFLVYFIISLRAGFILSPPHQEELWGIPYGIFIFSSLHLLALFGYILFQSKLPRRKHTLVPLFYSLLFYILGYFPGLAWLERWIEGIDLLLCLICLYSLLEEEEETDRDHQRGPHHKS